MFHTTKLHFCWVLSLLFILSGCQIIPTKKHLPFPIAANQTVDNSDEFKRIEGIKVSPTFLSGEGLGEKVQFWINYFTQKDRERFIRFLQNGASYRHIVTDIFDKHYLPHDLYYLGLVESGYQLGVRSRAKAIGPWQFMATTARSQGLRVDRDVDERRNLFKSTEAAAKYLKFLFEKYHSWELAMAAYNSGPGRVNRAIREGSSENYYDLCQQKVLPKETCHHVAKILATKLIEDNLDHFKLQGVTKAVRPVTKLRCYHLTFSMKVNEAIKFSGLTEDDFKFYNSDLLRHEIKVKRGTHRLYLPEQAYERFVINITKTYPVKVASFHIVKNGETLADVASRYQISEKNLMEINTLNDSVLYPQQKLAVPTSYKL